MPVALSKLWLDYYVHILHLSCFLCICILYDFVFFSFIVFFFKQKTAYEMRISDWSSDVCSSDLSRRADQRHHLAGSHRQGHAAQHLEPLAGLDEGRSEERRVGKSVSGRVDLGGRRIIKKKKHILIGVAIESKRVIINTICSKYYV